MTSELTWDIEVENFNAILKVGRTAQRNALKSGLEKLRKFVTEQDDLKEARHMLRSLAQTFMNHPAAVDVELLMKFDQLRKNCQEDPSQPPPSDLKDFYQTFGQL